MLQHDDACNKFSLSATVASAHRVVIVAAPGVASLPAPGAATLAFMTPPLAPMALLDLPFALDVGASFEGLLVGLGRLG